MLHLLPLSAFSEHRQIDLSAFDHPDRMIWPLNFDGIDWRLNLDGFLTFSPMNQQGSVGYTQVFRSGAVETASVLTDHEQDMVLPSTAYELRLIKHLKRFGDLAHGLGIDPPVYAFLSMVGVRGCRLDLGVMRAMYGDDHPLSQDVALLPEVVVEDFRTDPGRLLRPVFDVVWNAFGLPKSLNYDEHGNWTEQT